MNHDAEMTVKRTMMTKSISTIPFSRSYGYSYVIDYWKAIRDGSFPEKERLATELGLSVQDIWR